MKEIGQVIVAAIKDSNFHAIAKDSFEVVIDSFLKDGLLKDIPFMGGVSGFFNMHRSVQDQLFLKKIVTFLIHSEATTAEERIKVIQEIDDSKEHRIKVGEKLMYIINKFDDHIKAGIFGYLYKEFTLRKLKYDDLLRCALVLDKCLIRELDFFLKSEPNTKYGIEHHSELLEWGLLSLAALDISLEKDEDSETKLEGGQLVLKVSNAGRLLRFHLREYLEDQLNELGISAMTLTEARAYFDKIKKHPKGCREVYLEEFILKLCSNFEISDADFAAIVTENAKGKFFYIGDLHTAVIAYEKEQRKRGNDFNIARWERYYESKKEAPFI